MIIARSPVCIGSRLKLAEICVGIADKFCTLATHLDALDPDRKFARLRWKICEALAGLGLLIKRTDRLVTRLIGSVAVTVHQQLRHGDRALPLLVRDQLLSKEQGQMRVVFAVYKQFQFLNAGSLSPSVNAVRAHCSRALVRQAGGNSDKNSLRTSTAAACA